jgi:hypothetical protein
MRVDRFLHFAVTLRRLRSAHRDHQPHLVESRTDRVPRTRTETEEAPHVEIAFGMRGDAVDLDSQLFGPDAPGDDLAGQQRG